MTVEETDFGGGGSGETPGEKELGGTAHQCQLRLSVSKQLLQALAVMTPAGVDCTPKLWNKL